MIAALLSFYDEPPRFMRELVKSLRIIGCRDLVAVDGAYGLYPDGKPHSPEACCKALRQACYQNGVRLHRHTPMTVWEGGEIEKRTFMFRFAEDVTTEDDWYFIIDGDEVVRQGPSDLPEQLAPLKALVACADLMEPNGSWENIRRFFRAKRGIRIDGSHYNYVLPDGTRLYGNRDKSIPAAQLPVLFEHRNEERPNSRRAASLNYYETRDAVSPEEHQCAWCEKPTTVCIPYGWEHLPGGVTGHRTGCCEGCYPQRTQEAIAQAAELGWDITYMFPGADVNIFR